MIRLFAALTSVVTVAACGAPSEQPEPEPVTLNVFAASSLKEAFTELAETFEADHEGTKVVFTFGGSSDLVAQIQQGAPADVFASADEKNMAKLEADSLIDGAAKPFASNTLRIAVPSDNPAGVTGLADLASRDVDVVVCAPEVPCGSAATKVAAAANLSLHIVSEEQNVADVLNKVASGQADAGLVYVTDVKATRGKVKGIAFPEAGDAVNTYPIAAVAGSKRSAEATAFADFVLGPTGQKALVHAGFAKP